MRTLALSILLATSVPGLALAAPASPGPLKRFAGRYTDKVHPMEVRDALQVAAKMSASSNRDAALLRSAKMLAPKISIFSLRRLMSGMGSTESQYAAASYYILAHAESLSPKDVVEIAAGLQPFYPKELHDLAGTVRSATTHVNNIQTGRAIFYDYHPNDDVHRAREVISDARATLNNGVKRVEDAAAAQHDQLIQDYLGHRHGMATEMGADGLSASEMLVLSGAARLPATKASLEQIAAQRAGGAAR